MKRREGADLPAQIRRSAKEKPRFAVERHGGLYLRARGAGKLAGAKAGTIGAAAVPLRKSAARGCAKDLD